MKILGLVFSGRSDGNSFKTLDYCLDGFRKVTDNTEIISINDLSIHPCGKCKYECCKNGACPINDDISDLFKKCLESDLILFSLPTYCGHLPSSYFIFSERSQAILRDKKIYEDQFLKKINIILIGNIIAGGDMALHEALNSFTGRGFFPETVLLSSRDYNMKPIDGNLIENSHVRHKLDGFIERIQIKHEQ